MNDVIIDKEKLKKLLEFAYALSKDYKTVNSNTVNNIIEEMKKELKDDED